MWTQTPCVPRRRYANAYHRIDSTPPRALAVVSDSGQIASTQNANSQMQHTHSVNQPTNDASLIQRFSLRKAGGDRWQNNERTADTRNANVAKNRTEASERKTRRCTDVIAANTANINHRTRHRWTARTHRADINSFGRIWEKRKDHNDLEKRGSLSLTCTPAGLSGSEVRVKWRITHIETRDSPTFKQFATVVCKREG
ncbi:hypothetical protein Tcan_14159 [Toxocara canis]|uniref:Uncharacterized protein n=1 Tax=Toxocara canis TaxID=6265 RepID=A0A0B2UZA4_TOXCA|nr:hypothetical protein Tcan_14159 [Toxocara canis]